jgi:hypothetical protein
MPSEPPSLLKASVRRCLYWLHLWRPGRPSDAEGVSRPLLPFDILSMEGLRALEQACNAGAVIVAVGCRSSRPVVLVDPGVLDACESDIPAKTPSMRLSRGSVPK